MNAPEQPIDPHKDIIAATRKALEPLTSSGIFRLERLELHQEHQDNIVAVLKSNAGIEVAFIRGGQEAFCQLIIESLPIKHPDRPDMGRSFYADQVLEGLGLEILPTFMSMDDRDAGFVEMISVTSNAILKHWPILVRSFDDEHRSDTIRTINRYFSMWVQVHWLEPLTYDGTFRVTDLRYDETLPAVSLITLISTEGIEIRFTYDGKKASCTLSLPHSIKDSLRLDDVLEAVGVKPIRSEERYLMSITSAAANTIRANWEKIKTAFDDQHIADTLSRIETVRRRRDSQN